jgi:hypothetical protein
MLYFNQSVFSVDRQSAQFTQFVVYRCIEYTAFANINRSLYGDMLIDRVKNGMRVADAFSLSLQARGV